MEEIWQRIVENLVGRLDGPLHLRIIIQPLMALIFATIDGLKDAKHHYPAYFWAMAVNPDHRRTLLQDGWKHFGKIFILAIILDVIYQLKVQHTIYPGEVIIVALALAVVPYVLLRGPVNRVARLFQK
jgi:hypothetical protein